MLSGAGLVKGMEASLGSAAASASAAGARAAGAASSAAPSAASPAARDIGGEGGLPSWVWIVGAVVVLALLAWFFLGRGGSEKTAVAPPPVQQSVSKVDPADLGKQAGAALDGLKATLSSITDADSAKAALPKITDTTTKIDSVGALATQLSSDARKAFAGEIAPAVSAVKDQMDKIAATPGVGDAVKPAFDGLKAKLDALAAA
jgi:hypothetical protein